MDHNLQQSIALVHGNLKGMHMTFNQIKHLREYFE